MKNLFKQIDDLQAQINDYRPVSKDLLKQIKEYYRVGLTYTSNAIEGNSLTETETKIIIEDGITVSGKSVKEHCEVLGHSEAYDLLYKLAKHTDIKEKDILTLHNLFYYRIDKNNAGKYRKVKVFVTGTDYVFPKPEAIKDLMKRFVDSLATLQKDKHPIEYSALVHKELVTIHPFVDGNGRVARLLMNLALMQHGFVITLIPPILRPQYIAAIKQSQTENKIKPFITFIAERVRETQKDYLRMLE